MFVARACVLASALACIAVGDASAQSQREREWVDLGCYDIVRNGFDEGQIRVETRNTDIKRFTAIRLKATGSTVRMQNITTIYSTGRSNSFAANVSISDGNQSDPYDLPGNSREIRLISMQFQSIARSTGPRRLCVEGQVARVQQNWKELGCHTVDFRQDRDVIRVRGPDSYEAIRLTARDAAIFMQNFKVNHTGGNPPESFTVNARIGQDLSTRRFALQSDGQRIRDIELSYRTPQSQSNRALVCVEGLVAAFKEPAPDQRPPPGWKELGCHTVDVTGGIGEVVVGREKGRFRAIQLRVRENDVRLQGLDVRLANGERLGFPELDRVNKNSPSPPLSMGARPHRIAQIEIKYRAASRRDGQAFLCVDGLIAEDVSQDSSDRDTDRQADWKLIGCQPVKASRESDVYEVGRDEGPFRAIRFQARRNEVSVREMRIVYASGNAERVNISADREIVVPNGSRSREIDLPGAQRNIQKIELTYRSRGGNRDEAILCVEGLLGRARLDDSGRWRREPISIR